MSTHTALARTLAIIAYERRFRELDLIADEAQRTGRSPRALRDVGLSIIGAMGLLVAAQKAELVDPEPKEPVA